MAKNPACSALHTDGRNPSWCGHANSYRKASLFATNKDNTHEGYCSLVFGQKNTNSDKWLKSISKKITFSATLNPD
jgi:hypothetical protein